MKKLIIPALAVMMLASCSNNAGSNANGKESDSTQTKCEAKADNADCNKTLSTPDLTLFDVKGPVHFIKIGEDDNFVYEFNPKGELIAINNDDKIFSRVEPERQMQEDGSFIDFCKLTRNAQGFIEQEDFMESGTTYKWVNNRVESYEWGCEGSDGIVEYKYDENGDVSERIEKSLEGNDEEYTIDATIKYQITKRDDFGNWIERKATNDDDNYTETRRIEYFK